MYCGRHSDRGCCTLSTVRMYLNKLHGVMYQKTVLLNVMKGQWATATSRLLYVAETWNLTGVKGANRKCSSDVRTAAVTLCTNVYTLEWHVCTAARLFTLTGVIFDTSCLLKTSACRWFYENADQFWGRKKTCSILRAVCTCVAVGYVQEKKCQSEGRI
jgi:hypothetical protein